jgi:hypothetical protein
MPPVPKRFIACVQAKFIKKIFYGARRQFKTRISLLAQPNFTPPISGAKVLADASISASAA